jgi:hypothetical protein
LLLLDLLAHCIIRFFPMLWSRAISAQITRLTRARRQWHPRTPEDCPLCVSRQPSRWADLVEVVPWRGEEACELGGRDVPERVVRVAYYGCGVETIHAMVSCGVRGKTDRMRRWKCQACGTTVTERKYTVLYQLKTPPGRISLVMALLANGLDVSAAARVFRHDDRTTRRWLSRGGRHAAALHDLFFRRLRCAYLQLDELVASVWGNEEDIRVEGGGRDDESDTREACTCVAAHER